MQTKQMNKIINYFTYKYDGDWDSIYNAIQNKELIPINSLDEFNELDNKIKYISIIDQNYPDNYKSIYMPPLTIYYCGNLNIIYQQKPIISLWGDIDENIENLVNTDHIYALEYTPKNLETALKYSKKNINFIIVDFAKYNEDIVQQIKNNSRILYISEIPFSNKNINLSQNKYRMLLGVSEISIFIGNNNQKFNDFRKISEFEKRKICLYGNINSEYLKYGKRYIN